MGMSREEAIFCEKSYIGETNCTDCKYYGTDTCQSRESHRMAVKALEQEPILDKIRAEIEQYQSDYDVHGTEYDRTAWKAFNRCLQIIDKYKAETEAE